MKTMIVTTMTAVALSLSMMSAHAGDGRRGGQTGASQGGIVNVSPNVNLGNLKLLNNIGILNGNKTNVGIGNGILSGIGVGILNTNVRNDKAGRRR